MLRQFSKRVYYSNPAEETDRPVLGYIAGERYSLMIDAGNSSCHVEDFYCGLDEQGLKRPDFVVLTHSHWDHSFGLCRTGAVSISCRETAEELGKLSSVEWNLERLEKAVEAGLIPLFCREHILKEYPDLSRIKVVRPDICFEEELALDLGGATCLLKKLVSPHAEDCAAVYIPEEKVLFVGDADCEKICGREFIDNKEKLKKLERSLSGLEFHTVFTGHSQPEPKEDLFRWFHERLSK